MRRKVALTLRAAPIDTLQASAPVQAPDQPPKRQPSAGAGVSTTVASTAIAALQVLPQAMPEGDDVTVPVPLRVTLSVLCVRVKTAPTEVALPTVTLQGPVPLQAPVQPANTDCADGVAVSVIALPKLRVTEQVLPQLRPVGDETTVPVPVPDLAIVTA